MVSPLITPLNQSQSQILTNLQRLSSGQKINTAADNPAGLAIANLMSSQLDSQSQAINNTTTGLSVTDTAGGALSQVTENLQSIRELTVQAGNGTLSSADLQSIHEQIKGYQQNIDAISSNTQFNGQALLDGNFAGQIQIGPNSGDTLSLSLGNTSSAALGIAGLNLSSADDITHSLQSIDKALGTVDSYQSSVGANAAGLNSALSNLSNSYAQLSSSRSQIQNTDYAETASNLSASNLKNKAALFALKQYQENQKSLTSGLLG